MYIITTKKILKISSFLVKLIGIYITKKCKYYIYYTNNEKLINLFKKENKFLCKDVKDVISYLLFHKGEN